jgi:hypothetical protein
MKIPTNFTSFLSKTHLQSSLHHLKSHSTPHQFPSIHIKNNSSFNTFCLIYSRKKFVGMGFSHCVCSQRWQLLNWRSKNEVFGEKCFGMSVHEFVGLSDGGFSDASNVSDFLVCLLVVGGLRSHVDGSGSD